MRLTGKCGLILLATLTSAAGLAWGQSMPSERPARELRFERYAGPPYQQMGGRSSMPYRAVFQTKQRVHHSIGVTPQHMKGTAAWQRMSEKQRVQLANTQQILAPAAPAGPYEAGIPLYAVYAVTEEDARLTVQAALECLDDLADKARQSVHQCAAEAEKALAEAKEGIPNLERHIVALKQRRQELGQALTSAPVVLTADELRHNIIEYSDLLRATRIDIAGLTAKIKTAQEMLDNPVTPPRAEELQRQLANLNVDLVGAMARKTAVEESLRLASELYAVEQEQNHAETQLKKLQDQMDNAPKVLARAQEALGGWEAAYPEILDNRVVIERLPERDPKAAATATRPASPASQD